MAYVTQDQALNYLQGGQGQQQGIDPTSNQQQVGTGGGSFVASTGGVGQARGGLASPWTNIDSYLKANQSQLGSGLQAVGQKTQDVLGKEKATFEGAKQGAESALQKEQGEMVGKDAASKMVEQSSSGVTNQGDVQKLQGYVGGSFDRPNYDYSLSNQFQNYQKAYKDPTSFQNFKQDIYGDITGRALTSGQKALQNQMDLLSGQAEPMIQDYNKQFTDYTKQSDDYTADLGARLDQAQKDYDFGRADIQDYLNKSSADYQNELGNLANKFNQDYAAQEAKYADESLAYNNLPNELSNIRRLKTFVPGFEKLDPASRVALGQALKSGNQNEIRKYISGDLLSRYAISSPEEKAMVDKYLQGGPQYVSGNKATDANIQGSRANELRNQWNFIAQVLNPTLENDMNIYGNNADQARMNQILYSPYAYSASKGLGV